MITGELEPFYEALFNRMMDGNPVRMTNKAASDLLARFSDWGELDPDRTGLILHIEKDPESHAIICKIIEKFGKWDRRFLALANHIRTWSRDPSTQVGAVIVRPDRTIASVGFNGFPRGTSDDPALYADREVKYQRVVHAEINAILSAREPLSGYCLYVAPLHPCSQCAAAIIQSGIKRVVAQTSNRADWADRFKMAKQLFDEAGVEVIEVEATE